MNLSKESNRTFSSEHELFVDVTDIFLLIIGILIIFLTLAFNLFIIFTVLLNKQMQNFTNIQFAFMSCADMLVGAIAMPSLLISAVYGYWPLGPHFCALWSIGDFVGGNLSIITLTIVSGHRLQCIKKPFVTKKSNKEALKPSLIAWPIVILFWSIPIFYISYRNNNYRFMNSKECFFMYSFEYVLIADLVGYVLPVLLLVYFQTSIYISLKNKRKLINPKRNSVGNDLNSRVGSLFMNRCKTSVPRVEFKPNINCQLPQNLPDNVSTNSFNKCSILNDTSNFSDSFKKRLSLEKRKSSCNEQPKQKVLNQKIIFYNFRQYKNRKAFRTLLSVTCSLILFWMPWIVFWPLDAYFQCMPRYGYVIIYSMEYLNSLINSIFIVVGNQHFRRRFLNLKRFCLFNKT